MKQPPKPLMLIILDGWGMEERGEADALARSPLPNFRRLWSEYPHTDLGASGMDVGLPAGQMGNSEVGHMNIGAGRIIYQEYSLITKAIQDGDFFTNAALCKACSLVKAHDSALHLMGLLSDGGVHSHISHLFSLLRLAKQQGVEKVFIHCFMDGRDTPPDSGKDYLAKLERFCAKEGVGKIASVCGRFYAMDRDTRWERVSRAYRMMVYGDGKPVESADDAILISYAAGVTDEFVEPMVIEANGRPIGMIQDNDAVVFYNFRADRAREISHAFTDTKFAGFDRGAEQPKLSCFVTLTSFDEALTNVEIAFPPHRIVNTFTEILAANQLQQLRIAETEKYAHVTFFFNGGVEEIATGEDRCLIPSPKVETYDLKPEMSAGEVTDEVIARIRNNKYDVIILNFANPDMVGHTGILEAAEEAVQFVDICLGRIVHTLQEVGGAALITADHGNAERMREHGRPITAHTTNRVPCILMDDSRKDATLHSGRLEDLVPTMLQILGIALPAEMTGRSLID